VKAQPDCAVDAYYPLVQRLARSATRRLGSAADADDVTQEVIITLLSRERKGVPVVDARNAAAYVAAIVRNTARRVGRKHRRAGVLGAYGDLARPDGASGRPDDALLVERRTPEQQLVERAHAEFRIAAIKLRLAPKAARALDLLVASPMSARELSEALGTSENHVHQIRHRILVAARSLDERDA